MRIEKHVEAMTEMSKLLSEIQKEIDFVYQSPSLTNKGKSRLLFMEQDIQEKLESVIMLVISILALPYAAKDEIPVETEGFLLDYYMILSQVDDLNKIISAAKTMDELYVTLKQKTEFLGKIVTNLVEKINYLKAIGFEIRYDKLSPAELMSALTVIHLMHLTNPQ